MKTIKGLGKNSSGLVKYFRLAVQGWGGRPDGDALIKTVHYLLKNVRQPIFNSLCNIPYTVRAAPHTTFAAYFFSAKG